MFEETYDCPIYLKMRQMLSSANSRAQEFGRDFDLDLEHLCSLYREICPILGIELLWSNRGKVAHGSPSLDRVDNSKGYIKGNVQIISYRANSLKRDYLRVEWEKMVNYMESGGELITITDEHFKQPINKVLTPQMMLNITRARKQGETVAEIADGLLLPFGLVGRYLSQIEARVEDEINAKTPK